MSIIDNILNEAADELGLDKKANDQDGAPENSSNTNTGTDIVATANAFLQQLEQFKASIQDGAANNTGQIQDPNDPNAQVDPNADPNAQVDPNAQATPGGGGATIQTPGGSIIKVGSLFKFRSLVSKN